MKKVFILICALIMTIDISTAQRVDASSKAITINSEPITEVLNMTLSEKELDSILLNKGVEYDVVSNMSYFNKYDLYNDLLPKNAEYAGTKTIGYDEKTGDSYVIDPNSKGQISGSSLLLRISSVNYYSDDYYLEKIILKVSYDWKVTPFWKLTDSIGMSWESSEFRDISTTFIAKNCGYDSTVGNAAFCQTINDAASYSSSGLFWYTNLNNAYHSHFGYGKIYLYPKTGVNLVQGTSNFYALYVHKHLHGSLGINIAGINLTVDSGSYYDSLGAHDTHSWNISHMH